VDDAGVRGGDVGGEGVGRGELGQESVCECKGGGDVERTSGSAF
jgi:hypothetical protein